MNVGHLLTHTITIAAPSGTDSNGDPTFSAQTTMAARIEHGTKLIVGSDGVQKQSEVAIVTETEIAVNTRIWLPGDSIGDVNAAKRPITTKKADTFGGYFLYETYV